MENLSRKIEDRAVAVLQSLINEHPTMDAEINRCDKKMSWDGYIRIYKEHDKNKNGNVFSDKKNFEADIPIQIKGHVYKNEKTIQEIGKKVPVAVDDLNVYYRSYGCLYFQIYISEDGKDAHVFYNSLFPSKILVYLNFIKGKKNKKTYNVRFTRLKLDCWELENLCWQFASEIRRQGSGRGQIIQRTIDISNLPKVKEIHLSAMGANNTLDVFKSISEGNIVVYGSYEEGGVHFPFGWGDSYAASMKRIIQGPVIVQETVYYEKFEVLCSAAAPGFGEYTGKVEEKIIFSPNLCAESIESGLRFHLDMNTDIMQISKDAEFLLTLLKEGRMLLDGNNVCFDSSNVTDSFRLQLVELTDIGKALKDIGCRIDKPLKDYCKDDIAQIELLKKIWRGQVNFSSDYAAFTYDWKIFGKYFPFIVEKIQKTEHNTSGGVNLVEYMFNDSLRISYGSPEQMRGEQVDTLPKDAFVVPNYVMMKSEQLGNLLFYDYESMLDQIDYTVVNENTVDVLDALSLNLIKAYDLSGNDRLLEVARELLYKIEDEFSDRVNVSINLIQIEKRFEGILSNESEDRIKELLRIADEIPGEEDREKTKKILEFCIDVLHGDKTRAIDRYNKLSEKEKSSIDGYPIMTLYKDL